MDNSPEFLELDGLVSSHPGNVEDAVATLVSLGWHIPEDEIDTEWKLGAACAGSGIDPDAFYPGKGREAGSDAKQFCRKKCAAQLRCLRWALEIKDEWAVLGGFNRTEREEIQDKIDSLADSPGDSSG